MLDIFSIKENHTRKTKNAKPNTDLQGDKCSYFFKGQVRVQADTILVGEKGSLIGHHVEVRELSLTFCIENGGNVCNCSG